MLRSARRLVRGPAAPHHRRTEVAWTQGNTNPPVAAIFALDPDGIIPSCNAGAEHLEVGGDVTLESAVGSGSTFTFTLARADSAS